MASTLLAILSMNMAVTMVILSRSEAIPPSYKCKNERCVTESQPSAKDVQAIALLIHNELRKDHKAPPVTMDPQLTAEAQKHADRIVTEGIGIQTAQQRAKNGLQGYNTFSHHCFKNGPKHKNAMELAVVHWYRDKNDYKPEEFTQDPRNTDLYFEEFTRIVWKATKKIGAAVAFAYDKDRHVAIVAYSPPGNVFSTGKDKWEYFRGNVTI